MRNRARERDRGRSHFCRSGTGPGLARRCRGAFALGNEASNPIRVYVRQQRTTIRDQARDPGFLAPARWVHEMPGTCTASGEVDRATAAVFQDRLYDAIDNSADEVVIVDCSAVTFMDSTGYHALVNATEYAFRHGHTLVVRNMSSSCARLLRICDSDHELHLQD